MPLLWHSLPAEIKMLVIQKISQGNGKMASLAAVSREWQTLVEQHTFARIRLTPTRLADFDVMTSRNRDVVRYLWLCLELEPYDCTTCAYGPTYASDDDEILNDEIDDDDRVYATKPAEDALIRTALQSLFSVLSSWESNDTLSLDISVYSPSDSEHWFKHLTFEPDTPWTPSSYDSLVDQAVQARARPDTFHDWEMAPIDMTFLPEFAVRKVFGQIMMPGPFEDQDQEQEDAWWLGLPLIPAVTAVLMRNQNRRRWKPRALANIISRFPRLRVLHWEPWTEWTDDEQSRSDGSYRHLLKYLASTGLSSLTIFENFHEQYSRTFAHECQRIRRPNRSLGQMLALASLSLTSLSASYMVDANDFFFDTSNPPMTLWPHLTTVVLTSQLLTPKESRAGILDMLQTAGSTAIRMPKLKTMEIWNGRENLAALFKYELLGDGQPSTITWRGTWHLSLQPRVIKAWEAVSNMHRASGLRVVYETLAVDKITSHANAILSLKLPKLVIRPISLQQIQINHMAQWIPEAMHY